MIKTVHVNTSTPYDIIIGEGLFFSVSRLVSGLGLGKKAMIVTDDTVGALYLDTLREDLTNGGYEVHDFVFPHGEKSKCMATYSALITALAKAHFDRSDAIFALGGGVVGDLAGFCAATYLRGIRFIQIPTTLLAATDSSVGGKTAIDIPEGKNLVGAFWQPSMVICDPKMLDTLPSEYFSDGMAEVIKYAMIRDESLVSLIKNGNAKKNISEVIERSVKIKRDVVSEDEREGGIRAILNFGHTIAHSIEAESNYEISHGRAVGIGMALITLAAEREGICKQGTYKKLVSLLRSYRLDYTTAYSAESLYSHSLSDKKRSSGSISLILPESMGCCKIVKTPLDRVLYLYKRGTEK